MIICNPSCSIFQVCKNRKEQKRCFYDYGIKKERDENYDEFLEKLMY